MSDAIDEPPGSCGRGATTGATAGVKKAATTVTVIGSGPGGMSGASGEFGGRGVPLTATILWPIWKSPCFDAAEPGTRSLMVLSESTIRPKPTSLRAMTSVFVAAAADSRRFIITA